MREHDERDAERSEKAAAEGKGKPQAPAQDETDDVTWDSDEHSDAPGPFGTG